MWKTSRTSQIHSFADEHVIANSAATGIFVAFIRSSYLAQTKYTQHKAKYTFLQRAEMRGTKLVKSKYFGSATDKIKTFLIAYKQNK